MYSLAKRSDFFQSNTPINVGPGSYDTSGLIMSLAYGHAPFQSLKPRDLSLSNADAKLLPAPNEYHPRMQTRILGGSAMQNRAPRFNYRQKSGPGPCDYPPYSEDDEASTSPPHSGRLVRASTRHKTSTAAFSELAGGVPAGFQEYQEKPVRQRVRRTSQQIAKCSPCVLHGSLNLGRYRGVNFGKMTSRDAFPDNGSEPGPGDYDVGHFDLYVPVPYTNKKWWKLQNGKLLPRNPCSTVKCGSNRQTPGIILNPDDPALGEAPSRIPCSFDPDAAQPNSLRYLDVLVEKTLRENFPAPNAYHVIKDICEPLQLAKKKCGKKERERVCEEDWKEIFFQSIREKLNVKRRNMKPIVEQPFISSTARFSEPKERRPGPADYYIHASSIASETVDCPLPGVAFNHRSARFPNVKLSPTAGPGDYNMLGMTDELMRRIRPRYCWLKRDSGKKVVFGSSASRVTDLVPAWVKELPGPSDYDTRVRQCAWKYRIRICPRRPHAEFVRSSVDLGGPSMRPARTSGERTSVVEARPAGRRVTFRPCPGKRRRMGRRRRRQERLPNPFKTKKRLPEVTPGPALYYPEIAKDNAVLKKGYSVRMDSRTIRFPDTFEDIPGPGHYQTVTTEMLKRSFNVKFARLAGREPRVRPLRSDPLTAGRCVVSAEGSYCPSTSRRQAPAKVPSVLLGWRGKRFSVTRDPDENY